MVETVTTFECYWCKEYDGLEQDEYTYRLEYFGGFDVDGKPICDGCMDLAIDLSYDETE